MTDKYILEGKSAVPCNSLMEWAKWFEGSGKQRQVADDTIGDSRVSTVFLGIDHSFGGTTPILFETMVFGGHLDQDQARYTYWEDAEKGHKAMVERVKKEKAG